MSAMINDLLKIQQDMGAPQHYAGRRQKDARDDQEASEWGNPDDWVANVPKFSLYHNGYTTQHWLQVFRPA